MKRLGHTKSRTGCQRCKKRRVKCDEAIPCSACLRHKVWCSLQPHGSIPSPQESLHASGLSERFNLSLQSRSPQELGEASSSRDSVSDVDRFSTPEGKSSIPLDPIPYFSKFFHHVQRGSMEDWAQDLELLHHYTVISHRSFTFWGEVQVHHTLQYDVPREGMRHSFLLHQILAFSGFHLAYLEPERCHFYSLRASQHQDRAITGIRAALSGGLTPNNCHALYASSIFLIISAYATFPSCEIHNSAFAPFEGLIDIFSLIDGISMIMKASDRDLREGPLKGLFPEKSGPIPTLDHLQLLIDQLKALDPWLSTNQSTEDHVDIEVIAEAAKSLIESILATHQNYSVTASVELRAAFLWQMKVSNKYLDLTRQRNPMAMVVLAHYCVLLKYAETTCWFLKGWAKSVTGSIMRDLIGLPHSELVNWAEGVVN